MTTESAAATGLRRALTAESSSARLEAALAAGTHPQPEYVDVLIERCAIETDFYVREMLTWALVRHPADLTVPRLLEQTTSVEHQAQSQALHTLSKIGDPRGWSIITPALLRDEHDDVARTAWRAAVMLAPLEERPALAATLATQFARGEREVRSSLTRAFFELGDAAAPALEQARSHPDLEVRVHALATQRIIDDPDEGFESAMWEARRALTD